MVGDWKDLLLGDVIELKRGYDLPQQRRQKGTVPIVSSSGITDWHADSMVKGPGVVTGRYGTLGQVFYIAEDFWPLNTTLYVRDFKGNDPRFISYFLRSIDFFAFSDKAAVPGLNRNHLHMARVRFPEDLAEQRAIGEILASLDDKIRVNQLISGTLEAISAAIFKAWFLDFEPVKAKIEEQWNRGVTRPGLPASLYDCFSDRLSDTALGVLPEGWKITTLEKMISLVIDHRGKTPFKLSGDWAPIGIPVLSAKNVKSRGLTDMQDIRFVSEELYRRWMSDTLESGDVLLTSEGPLGEVYFLASKKEYCLGQRLFGLRADTKITLPSYLYLWLRSHAGQNELHSRATGTTVLGIRQSELLRCQVLLPPMNIQRAFEALVRPMLERIALIEEENASLTTIQQLVLPKLISGEIRVRQAARIVEGVV